MGGHTFGATLCRQAPALASLPRKHRWPRKSSLGETASSHHPWSLFQVKPQLSGPTIEQATAGLLTAEVGEVIAGALRWLRQVSDSLRVAATQTGVRRLTQCGKGAELGDHYAGAEPNSQMYLY